MTEKTEKKPAHIVIGGVEQKDRSKDVEAVCVYAQPCGGPPKLIAYETGPFTDAEIVRWKARKRSFSK